MTGNAATGSTRSRRRADHSPTGTGGGGRARRTSRMVALGHDFAVETTDPALADLVDELFAALAADGEPAHLYRITETPGPDGAEYELSLDGAPIVRSPDPSRPLAMLLWNVNRAAVEETVDAVLLHAAAAESAGAGVVMPGAAETGKSTLVAGLVRAGMRYLTDELTAVDPDTLRIRPFPRALSLDPGSWEVLADLEPSVDPAARRYLPHAWQVPPASIRAGAVAAGAAPRFVVLPSYRPGEPTALVPLTRADTLVRLTGTTFEFARDPAGTLDVLARMLRACHCYELVTTDLAAAVDAVLGLFDAPDRPGHARGAGR